MPATLLLDYAGPRRTASRSAITTCRRVLGAAVTTVILFAIVTVRFALLASGFACVFAGTLLLTLGGRRGAARQIARWRDRAADLLSLWSADIARPVRRWWHEPWSGSAR